ncbi:MAG: hypothetical protein ABFD50_17500 [Smithella sp.]
MSQLPVTIPKQPVVAPAFDYYSLRREGIGLIEKMASRLWTDYNTHDPGITILEACCYALTDLAYRTGWDIKDLLTAEIPSSDPSQPYPGQAFFPASEILTINPTTPEDFRRLLIDLEMVRNAWVFCKNGTSEPSYYAWCEDNQLQLSCTPPDNISCEPKPVSPRGLYEALLELESDPELGDLNDRKVEYVFTVNDSNGSYPVTAELRFPEMGLDQSKLWAAFLESENVTKVILKKLGAAKTYDVFTDPELKDDNDRDNYIHKQWRNIFYLDFAVKFVNSTVSPGKTETLLIENVTMRLFSSTDAQKAARAEDLKNLFADNKKQVGRTSILKYIKKVKAAKTAVNAAKAALQACRNLDEDYCRIKVIDIEEVAVCADIEVKPDADIELVQAKIWFEIDRYFNPPVPFYSLQEMLNAGVAVEEIFNGPALKNGFIKDDELESASLKSVLCVSDIIDRLMDIDGVIAVNQLQMTKYDAEGNIVKGAADPVLNINDGKLVRDTNKISASWLLYISERNQPRLYLNASRFLFFKNGLPFQPRKDEVQATLIQLRGAAERPKIKNLPKDLPVPEGKYRNSADYYPAQFSLPATYGIGPAGLSLNATALRRAQAKQLKAYLLFFEQILGNAFAQIAHTADLFSLDPGVEHTYFFKTFTNADIQEYDKIINETDKTVLEAKLAALMETGPEFLKRRNRFLDHIMARFGEQFGEYTMLLTNMQGQQVARDKLIEDKIAFIKAYPQISHDRGKAFNYQKAPCSTDNIPGIKKRVCLLLGNPDLNFIVVEHLLLRPKFPGDALYPACSEGECAICGDEDPYSFRLTFVMPGWAEPFDKNMDMRNFADQTIRRETPSHLLGKICWVGNEGYIENQCNPVIEKLAILIEKQGVTSKGTRPGQAEACKCASALYKAVSRVFHNWYKDKTLDYIHPDSLDKILRDKLGSLLMSAKPAGISCKIVLSNESRLDMQKIIINYFHYIVLYGWQFERFEEAWKKWLEANAEFDWTEERLQECLEAILVKNLSVNANTQTIGKGGLAGYAAVILANYGKDFFNWMDGNFKKGMSLEDFKKYKNFPSPVTPHCNDFNSDTAKQIAGFLEERYKGYVEVSYRLWIVVNLLSKLRNIYPPATLHDWDEGNDQNPVRLGKTALGS